MGLSSKRDHVKHMNVQKVQNTLPNDTLYKLLTITVQNVQNVVFSLFFSMKLVQNVQNVLQNIKQALIPNRMCKMLDDSRENWCWQNVQNVGWYQYLITTLVQNVQNVGCRMCRMLGISRKTCLAKVKMDRMCRMLDDISIWLLLWCRMFRM